MPETQKPLFLYTFYISKLLSKVHDLGARNSKTMSIYKKKGIF
jgi:hypothetical protein